MKEIAVTETMLEQLGSFMVQKMEEANLWTQRNDEDALRVAQSAKGGMEKALTILGIPVRQAQSWPGGQYTYVEIGGKFFNVQTFEDE